jgi:hypothetical protein
MRRCCCDREGFGPLGNWWFWSVILCLSPLAPVGAVGIVIAIVWSLGRLVKNLFQSPTVTPSDSYFEAKALTAEMQRREEEREAAYVRDTLFVPAEWSR